MLKCHYTFTKGQKTQQRVRPIYFKTSDPCGIGATFLQPWLAHGFSPNSSIVSAPGAGSRSFAHFSSWPNTLLWIRGVGPPDTFNTRSQKLLKNVT